MRVSTIFTVASGIAAVSATDCAAAGEYDSQGRYSCNPAHQYPDGQTCKEIDGCPLLADAKGEPIYKSTCAAPGDYDDKGRYSCNPAHQYPDGQSCKTVEGCPLLVDASGKPIVKTPCAAAGDYDDKGRYSCNPAHQYPNGQSCKELDGCPLLVDAKGEPIYKSTCKAAGEYDDKGRYACNPAHQYPNGQTCKTIDGCPLLADDNGNAIVTGSTSASSAAQSTATSISTSVQPTTIITSSVVQPTSTSPPSSKCAAPGEYDSQGRYSCNPAHQYPNGQKCTVIDGCPLLCDGGSGKPIATGTTSGAQPTSISAPSSKCAAPGEHDSQGRYSCNPAHQYPNGQTCQVIDGCPLLCDGGSGKPIATGTTSAGVQPTSTSAPSSKCAAPGDYDGQGRYSCNPAHQYPNGQTCKVIDGCPLLCDASGKPIVKATASSSGNNGKATDVPIVVGAGSVLTGGMAMVAAALVAAI